MFEPTAFSAQEIRASHGTMSSDRSERSGSTVSFAPAPLRPHKLTGPELQCHQEGITDVS